MPGYEAKVHTATVARRYNISRQPILFKLHVIAIQQTQLYTCTYLSTPSVSAVATFFALGENLQ